MSRHAFLIAAAALVAAGGTTATASTRFTSCGSTPAKLRFHIQARGVGCTTARGVGKLVNQHVTTIRPRTFEYKSGGYTCRYTVFASSKAGDGEGEIFDCRRPHKEVRWSNAPGILPRTIAP